MNTKQYESSQQAITRMLDRIDERLGNALSHIHIIDFDKSTQADFINGIDAVAVDCAGSSHRLQFKSRVSSMEICLELATVPCATAVSYHSTKYDRNFLIDTKSADIFIQELNDGTTFIYSALQLHTMAQYDDFWQNPIHRNAEGQFLLFISADNFLLIEKNRGRK